MLVTHKVAVCWRGTLKGHAAFPSAWCSTVLCRRYRHECCHERFSCYSEGWFKDICWGRHWSPSHFLPELGLPSPFMGEPGLLIHVSTKKTTTTQFFLQVGRVKFLSSKWVCLKISRNLGRKTNHPLVNHNCPNIIIATIEGNDMYQSPIDNFHIVGCRSNMYIYIFIYLYLYMYIYVCR